MNRMDIISAIFVGEVLQNPQSGTSTISKITDDYIEYIRGKSHMRLPINTFLAVIHAFAGKKCSSTDLRCYMPEVFDSHNPHGPKGHSCNCTFLFMLSEKLGIIEGGIQGAGTRSGGPFYVVFNK